MTGRRIGPEASQSPLRPSVAPKRAGTTPDTSARSTGLQWIVIDDFPSPAIARTLSPNGRAHWVSKSTARKAVMARVKLEADRCRLRTCWGPVRLTFRYVYPTHRARDVDNLAGGGVTKAAIDALVRGDWLASDDSEHVTSVEAVPVVERGQRRLEIIVEPDV